MKTGVSRIRRRQGYGGQEGTKAQSLRFLYLDFFLASLRLRASLLQFCLILGLLSFNSAFSEDAIRNPFQAVPAGKWTLSATLNTRASGRGENAATFLQFGDKNLTIQIEQSKDGSTRVVYESPKISGIVLNLPKDFSKGGGTLTYLDGGETVADPKKPFLGSAFTSEDICLHFLGWKSEVLGEENFLDRPCVKKASRPGADEETSYSRVESWIDKEYNVPMKIVAYDPHGTLVKEFNVRSVQKVEGTWMLKTLELTSRTDKARSRLEISEVKKSP